MRNLVFKKGERVIAVSHDPRNPSEPMQVVSVGEKYITCQELYGENQLASQKIRFDVETLYRVDWSSYELFHSVEEFDEELKRKLTIANFTRELAEYSLEEIKFFREVHEQGLDKFLKVEEAQQ